MKEKQEAVRFTGQPSGHNFLGTSSVVSQKQIDEDLLVIKAFAKEHKLTLKEKKNKPVEFQIPDDFLTYRSYNEKLKYPVLTKEITYVITYTNWSSPITVKKNWNGYESKKPFRLSEGKTEETYRSELLIEIPIENLPVKNIRQIAFGPYKNISDALADILKDLAS